MTMTRGQFDTWVAQAAPGEMVVYFQYGVMAGDREVGAAAQRYARAGLITLFQRRVPDGLEYIAVRISPETARQLGEPWPATAPWMPSEGKRAA